MDNKKVLLDRELNKSTKILLDSMCKINASVLSDKTAVFQKNMGIKNISHIYEPMFYEYLKDEPEDYKKEMKESYNARIKEILSKTKQGEHKEMFTIFYNHVVEVLTTRKTTKEKLESLWK